VVCAGAAVMLQQSAVILTADWQSSVARTRLMKWVAKKDGWDDMQWEAARRDLDEALALTPQDATLHDALAQLYTLKGIAEWTTGEPGTPEMALYARALAHQQASLKIRPRHANSWANLASIHYGLNSPPEQVFEAWRQALRLGPYEPEVQQTLLSVAADTWEIAPEDVRQWAEKRSPGLGAEMARQAEAEAAAEAAAAASAATVASAATAASVPSSTPAATGR
jgi:tetratricopeptide (TPR) repeat protein